MSFSRIFGNIEANGIELAANTRNRLRASFMAAKMNAKVQDWTKADDEAFDAIDAMTDKLVADAGFKAAPQALSKEFLEKQAEIRGLKLVPIDAQIAAVPPAKSIFADPASKAERPRIDTKEETLEEALGLVVAEKRAGKPAGFA
jgi:hypothetical protein